MGQREAERTIRSHNIKRYGTEALQFLYRVISYRYGNDNFNKFHYGSLFSATGSELALFGVL